MTLLNEVFTSCPVDLSQPIPLYERLLTRLDELGQEDGQWAEGAALNDMVLTDHPVAVAYRKYSGDWVPAVSKGFAEIADAQIAGWGEQHAGTIARDLMWMAKFGVEFACSWKVIPIHMGGEDRFIVRGGVFPGPDKPDHICFFMLDEIFPSTEVAQAA